MIPGQAWIFLGSVSTVRLLIIPLRGSHIHFITSRSIEKRCCVGSIWSLDFSFFPGPWWICKNNPSLAIFYMYIYIHQHVSKNFLNWQMILTLRFCSVSSILFCREANLGPSTSSNEFSNNSNDSNCISAQWTVTYSAVMFARLHVLI